MTSQCMTVCIWCKELIYREVWLRRVICVVTESGLSLTNDSLLIECTRIFAPVPKQVEVGEGELALSDLCVGFRESRSCSFQEIKSVVFCYSYD